MISLIEEDEAKEEDVEQVIESNHVQEDEEKSSLLLNFDLEIKDVLDVRILVIEETQSEKEFSHVMLEEIPHGLPTMKDIQHQISLIPGLVFLNKLGTVMNTKENEKIKTQVDDLLDKGLAQESESSYVVPTVLVHEKNGPWRMCFYFQAFNNFLIHEEVRFNIRQRAEQYEKQENEGYQRPVFDPGGWIRLHMIKERCSKLRTRIDGPSNIIKKIIKNAYKLEWPDDNNILSTFNIKDLRPYHGEDLRTSLFSQL